MGLIYYKGKTYGGDSSGGGIDSAENLKFYAVEGMPPTTDLPTEISKTAVIDPSTNEQEVDEHGNKVWQVSIPVGHIIENAELYTSETQEFILNRSNMENLELHAGNQDIYGNLDGDFIAGGYYIYRGDIDGVMKRIKNDPSHLYTQSFGPQFSFNHKTSYLTLKGGSNNLFITLNGGAVKYEENEGYYSISQGNQYSGNAAIAINNTINNNTYKIKTMGFFLYYKNMISHGVQCSAFFVALDEGNNFIEIGYENNNGITYFGDKIYACCSMQSISSPNFFEQNFSSLEEQYFQGLTERRTHITSSEYASLQEGGIKGYYNDSNFYEDSGYSILITPVSGKIYIDKTTNALYRYNGSAYEVISL